MLALAAAGCAGGLGSGPADGAATERAVSDEVLRRNSSAPRLTIARGRVITDNDSAFEAKLAAVRDARRSIDLAYYIYADDHSSAVLTEALIEAARRGVQVRLLVDYFTNYRRLDH